MDLTLFELFLNTKISQTIPSTLHLPFMLYFKSFRILKMSTPESDAVADYVMDVASDVVKLMATFEMMI